MIIHDESDERTGSTVEADGRAVLIAKHVDVGVRDLGLTRASRDAQPAVALCDAGEVVCQVLRPVLTAQRRQRRLLLLLLADADADASQRRDALDGNHGRLERMLPHPATQRLEICTEA